jgi:uncharacterized membrane protein YhhN
MPVLMIVFFFYSQNKSSLHYGKYVWAALLLAWLGDIFLLNTNTVCFLAGMLSFLAMHIIYASVFFQLNPIHPKQLQPIVVPAIVLAVVCYSIFQRIQSNLGVLQIPVLVYMTVICCMFLLALNVMGNKNYNHLATRYLVPGALLFIVSDSLLALNMFYYHYNALGIAVMLTYGGAQYVLVEGMKRVVDWLVE